VARQALTKVRVADCEPISCELVPSPANAQRPSNDSHGHLRPLRNLMAVVIRMFVSPASIFCSVRMFKSASSASFSCVMLLAVRSRRRFAPNVLS
jgi:hypothetical protein